MIGGCSHFGLRSLQHLLVATIDQLRNLRTNQVAGIGENPDALFSIFLDRRRHVVLPQEHTSLSARRFDQVEAMIAKPLYGIFESSLFYFSCHFSPEIRRLSFLVGHSSSANPIPNRTDARYQIPLHCTGLDARASAPNYTLTTVSQRAP